MKVLSVIFGLFLLTSCGGNADVSVGNKTTMSIEEEFLAGDVIKGEMITAKFNIENTGEFPLVIGEVSGSCTCTVADYPEDPIMPGEKGEILAHVNTDKTGTGVINKSVRVVANTEPSVTTVWIRANVNKN